MNTQDYLFSKEL